MRTPEERKAYNKQYTVNNKEKISATQKAWRAANVEHKRAQSKKYRAGRVAEDAAHAKAYHAAHPEVTLRRQCKKRGITLEFYNSLPKECSACHTKDLGNFKLKSWPIDHDHKTGKFRGLLCSGCNLALGHLKDDPERCRALATYLEKHQ